MRLPRRANMVTFALFALSIVILGWTVYTNLNIDVIDNKTWKLILPTGPIYAGQTILIRSEYTKLRTVEGQSSRYIECWTKDNVQVAYLVNSAVANRAAGTGGTGLPIPIPSNIPDLPATCDIRVVVKYHVLPLRDVIEVKTSPTFTLLSASASGASSGATGTSPTPSPAVSQLQDSSLSSLHTAPSATNAQSVITQPASISPTQASPAPASPAPPAKPSIGQQIQTAGQRIPLIGRLFK